MEQQVLYFSFSFNCISHFKAETNELQFKIRSLKEKFSGVYKDTAATEQLTHDFKMYKL